MKAILRTIFLGTIVGCFAVATGAKEPAPPPKHLTAAVSLIDALEPSNTTYRHGKPEVKFAGDGDVCSSHTDCSGFVDSLLRHSYQYTDDDYRKWFGKKRPLAKVFHDTIQQQKGFADIQKVQDVLPGDILAAKYAVPTEDNSTGHVMLVVEKPKLMTAKEPFVDNTEQWEVTIIDSSGSGHGTTDTRNANGQKKDGLGRGVFRLYANKSGTLEGYCWSTSKKSKFRPQSENHLVVGRLVDGYRP